MLKKFFYFAYVKNINLIFGGCFKVCTNFYTQTFNKSGLQLHQCVKVCPSCLQYEYTSLCSLYRCLCHSTCFRFTVCASFFAILQKKFRILSETKRRQRANQCISLDICFLSSPQITALMFFIFMCLFWEHCGFVSPRSLCVINKCGSLSRAS